MEENLRAQRRAVYSYMLTVGPITQRIASAELNCDRLSARILELKEADVDIRSEWQYKRDEAGKIIKKWKAYYLANRENLGL